VPWPQPFQVEQDLILSRLIVEIANHELLATELAMRGGTCLHKLHLPEPLRYSEDLDYVRKTHSGIKPYLDALHDIAAGIGFTERSVGQSGDLVHLVLDAEPTISPGRIRLRIETNIKETASHSEHILVPYRVESGWWRGDAEVVTFKIEELMSTKLRALYQRSKGRDLFDLWLVLTESDSDDDVIIDGFRHYMGEDAYSYPQLADNLRAKLEDAEFLADLETLVAQFPDRYTTEAAADLVMERLGSKLRNAPRVGEIVNGRWRDSRPA
jgi:predicted nucleotidyltransferase component of viral defense system